MKPDYEKIRSVSNLTGERQVMTLDTNATEHLMGLLTDLYSDPELAVIREYSTNAYDATVDAGSSEPVRVTLPTIQAPNLVIQDFGIGMTTDEVLHTYSQYGNSTKRESNDVVGMLGVGCKSALTYTNSFIVTTVKNGVKTVANVTKNSDNVGEIQIIDTASSNERNGTTIQIPVRVKDIVSFTDKANEFFRYWKPGTVLIDGNAPEFIIDTEGYTKVNADVDVYYQQTTNWHADSVLVMGNVPYPLNITHKMGGANIIVFAPIGAVNFAPSREELSYRGKTDKYVAEIAQVIEDEIAYIIANAMNDAKDKPDAMRIANLLRTARWSSGQNLNFVYNGEKVPLWPLEGRQTGMVWNTATNWNGNNYRIERNPWGIRYTAIIIENGPGTLSAAHKYGLREKFGKDKVIYFPEKPINNEWIGNVYDWNTLRKTLAKPAPKTGGGAGLGDIDRTGRNFALLDSYGEFTGDYYDPAATDKVYFAFQPGNRPDKYLFSQMTHIGLTPIQVYKADFDTFVANENVYTNIDTYRQKFTESLTIEQLTTMNLRHRQRVNPLVILGSLDTEAAAMLDSKVEDGWWVIVTHSVEADDNAKKIAAKYPLLPSCSYGEIAPQIEYVNALYTTRKDS